MIGEHYLVLLDSGNLKRKGSCMSGAIDQGSRVDAFTTQNLKHKY